jgi:Amt family ammonium transporter
MMMNFMVYGVGMLAYWLIGFTIQMGGVGGVANLGVCCRSTRNGP